jgi:hypothetical protein
MDGTGEEFKRQQLVHKWLEKWRGGRARLWQYSVSHKLLVIRITHPLISGGLDVCCGDTVHISCDTAWEQHDLRLEVRQPGGQDLEYHLCDPPRGFRIVCGVVEVKEHAHEVGQ